jgi:uncharacterized membrane protein
MYQLTPGQTRWLKIAHLLFASAWVGGALSLVLVQYFKASLAAAEDQYAVVACLKFIDDAVIIPGALGSLATGLLYSLLTPWGFAKYRWVAVKWVLTVALILFGTFFLGPWINGMAAISQAERALAAGNATYRYYQTMNMLWGPVQLLITIGLIVTSVLKPWRKKN